MQDRGNARARTVHLLALWLFVTAASTAAAEPPATPSSIDFERHVMGVVGRMGCNSGSCHGSFQGKGGFRLSLFGYDPAMDHTALTRDGLGRRVNPLDPDHSLILLKATAQIPHEGGQRFTKDSWAYQTLRSWIASGAERREGSGTVADLTIEPPQHRFERPGESVRLSVVAHFADGSTEDVTRYTDFRVQDDAVAEVDGEGRVKGLQPGDTPVIVSYRGNVRTVRVLVPLETPPGFRYPEVAEVNYVDHEVLEKLRGLNIVPSGLSSDAEFLRRVTIDTIGSLPSPDEVRAFLADRDPQKRSKKIDELLAHPLHAALWATKFCDITGNNTDELELPREKHSQMWHDWFRKRLAANQPYDKLVHDVLCATSRGAEEPEAWVENYKTIEQQARDGFDTSYAERETLDLFWRRQRGNVPIEQWGEKVAAAFLGVRLECAQCHKHPFDRWTQEEYRAFANVFGQVAYGSSPETRKLLDPENNRRRKETNAQKRLQPIRELYLNSRARSLPDPVTNKPLPAKALGGPEIAIEPGKDARETLFAWLATAENPFFARSFVNRIWGHYFGTGIVEPVDDFSLANPPSNEALLDALARDFASHGFDIRHMERTILNSRTYQLSSDTNESNQFDRTNYSHSQVRPMMAEAVVDVLNAALDVEENLGNAAKPGSRAMEIGASRINNGNLAYVFRIFGRPPRTTACDCERAMDPALPQALYLMGDPSVLAKLSSSKGRLGALLQSSLSDEQILDELFLATLSRFPTEDDRRLFDEYRARRSDRREAFADTLWALINTREFILNH